MKTTTNRHEQFFAVGSGPNAISNLFATKKRHIRENIRGYVASLSFNSCCQQPYGYRNANFVVAIYNVNMLICVRI